MAKAKASKGNEYKALGNTGATRKPYGVFARFDAESNTLTLVIPVTADAIKGAPMSSSGKSKLVGNTAGFVKVPEVPGLSLSLCASLKPDKPAPAKPAATEDDGEDAATVLVV